MVWDAMVAVGSSPDADPAKRTRLPHIPITVSLIGKQSTLKLRTGIGLRRPRGHSFAAFLPWKNTNTLLLLCTLTMVPTPSS